jgi:CDP-diacylglycerol---glycerol-3-phosphate 3-phosphatidyltransferase
MAINAYARAIAERVVDPVGRGLARIGLTANGLTTAGVVTTFAGAVVLLTVSHRAGAVVFAIGALLDLFDGAVARARGTTSRFGAFYDSVADRVSDAVLLGASAWIVRDDPLLFGVAMTALAGAQATSYIRAKAESLGWNATVGVLERAERVIILILALAFGLLPLALWILAAGSVFTIVQRLRVVLRQARAEPATEQGAPVTERGARP